MIIGSIKHVSNKHNSNRTIYSCPLFVTLTYRFTGAHSHYFLEEFLQKVARNYLESSRAERFVLHLVQMRMKSFLTNDCQRCIEIQVKFKRNLQDYIQRCCVKHYLLLLIDCILVSLRHVEHNTHLDKQS